MYGQFYVCGHILYNEKCLHKIREILVLAQLFAVGLFRHRFRETSLKLTARKAVLPFFI